MHILLVDTSGDYLRLAIANDSNLLLNINYKLGRYINENLLTIIDNSLKNIKLDIADIDEYNVIKGPGSFTGIRIGIATIMGFALSFNKPFYGISLLDAYALTLDCSEMVVIYPLRKGIGVAKYYNFDNDNFSDYKLINSDSEMTFSNKNILYDNNFDLSKSLLNKKIVHLKGDYKPLYFLDYYSKKINYKR
ncbi:MAG: tRNA (adenosine(37)-N6)-threonylcarbamoyltransferase complex dimerization subunit type 1 TsaB [Deferribacterota bacterium]|nr:tRNA (adenosine(37)-N6)-threonylcarbamoyltransferase complex dimerization subunit type 1 TsaB [Deferribacterota bacterium]